ncbi:aromatic acid exporter family protein [Vagococcus salmoninarum]|uniref:aromatic acid exporter family protein n=1 Tax=Vagococcus salmoninarum TaxID=2739 RepID=UPI003F9A99C4
MPLKVGMRTVKTAVCAAVGIIIAQKIGLLYPASAGIIALLSVTNSKRSAFKTAILRVGSLALATSIAFIFFKLLGFNAVAFGVYLLVFIPLAVKYGMSDGIPVSSVLITHYLVEESLSLSLISNAFTLLVIGAGLALLANSYMPSKIKLLKGNQEKNDEKIKALLYGMASYLDGTAASISCDNLLVNVIKDLESAEEEAKRHDENQLLGEDVYFLDYFAMRRLQVNVLSKMNELVKVISHEKGNVTGVQNLLLTKADNLSIENDGQKMSAEIQLVLAAYRQAPLPKSREEFENRANLYQLLNEFQRFIDIKITYSEKLKT